MASDDNSGFCVSYTLRETSERGWGVYAAAPIRQGTILWRHVTGGYAVYDQCLFEKYIASMSPSEVVYELEHVFGLPEFPGYLIRVFDDGVLINHSREPTVALNNVSGGSGISYNSSAENAREVEESLLSDHFSLLAARDLEMGEELTQDYNIGIEDPSYYDALCERYDVSWPWLQEADE
jgi:SET domain-containing protein